MNRAGWPPCSGIISWTTDPEQSFLEITRLARDLVNVPMAYIAFLDSDRLWLKSCIGSEVKEVPREIAFCTHTVLQEEILMVPDTQKDSRFMDNPLVTGPPHLRFYAGFPVRVDKGYVIGTLCVVDVKPRALTENEISTLDLLSRLVTEKLELRRSQSAFSEAEEWYKILFHESDDAKILFNEALEVLEANRTAFNLFGYEHSSFLGNPITNIFKQQDQQRATALTHEALQGNQKRDTLQLVDIHGNPFPGECLFNMFESDEKKIGHLTVRDMTAQNAMDLALQESKLLFENVQTLAHIGSWAYFPESNRNIWSDELFKITGYPSEKGTPTFEEYLLCIPENDRQAFFNLTQKAIKNGEAYQFEHQIIQQDGSLKWVISQGQGLVGPDGKVEKLFGAIQDINERKQAEEEMLESQQRLKFHFMQSPMGYIEWDLDFNVLEWNPACQHIFGFKKEEVVGTLPSIVPEHLMEEVGALFVTLMKGEGGVHSINENITRDGKTIVCEWVNTSVRSSSGEIIAISSLVQDITERIESEAALKQYAEELEKAKIEAEMADKAKSTFLANMSHEIRTPLNGVIGMTSLLEQTGLDKEQFEYINIIKRSGESLLNLINDILDFSKLDADRVEIERHPFELNTCIEQSIELVRSRAAQNKIPIYFVPTGPLPCHVISDSKRLGQILNNLLANAVKFTQDGHIVLEVSYKSSSISGGELQFAITDTGIGIPVEKQHRLFKAFSQIDASTTRRYGGTGLGLKISSRLVELMGGRIWVESKENQGATFSFTIQCEVNKASYPSSPRLLQQKHILVANPLPTSQEYYANLLSSWGMQVTVVQDQKELKHTLNTSSEIAIALIDDALFQEDYPTDPGKAYPACTTIYAHWLNERHSDGSFDISLTKPVLYSALYETLTNHFLAVSQSAAHQKPLDTTPLRLLNVDDNAINGAITRRLLERPFVYPQFCNSFSELKEALAAHACDGILINRDMEPSSIHEILQWIYDHFEEAHRPWLFSLDVTEPYALSIPDYGTGFDLALKLPLDHDVIDQILSICNTAKLPGQRNSRPVAKS